MASTLHSPLEDATNVYDAPAAAPEQLYKPNTKKSYRIIKRLFDIAVSFLFGLVLLIPVAVVGLIIKLDSPGPAVYSQERLGKNGKPFRMYKLRSMYIDAEKEGPKWADAEDPRCTKVGRVIRKWHIDELPQLWNVLKGDMSIVGPRPEREYFYGMFEEKISEYRARLLVDQGLTCLSQVNGGYDITPEEKLRYDLAYIQNQSLWLDLKCILKTFGVVITHKGAR